MANTSQVTVRLPNETLEFIEQLSRHQILGKDRTAVLRALIDRAIDDLIKTDYIRNTLETRRALKE